MDLNAPAPRRLKFSLRDLLMAMMIVAIFLGWRASRQNSERRIAALQRQIQYAKSAEEWDKKRLRTHANRNPYHSQGLLAGANLENASLNGSTLVGEYFAFRRTVFNGANLQNATLTGGEAAFEGARFFRAYLKRAKLTGGSRAFHLASFIDADLSGAVLEGGALSFMGATFQRARLIGARVAGSGDSFQDVDIDAANFRAADLSALASESLKSCFFQTPPLYDAKTKFPFGFNPIDQGWKKHSK
jgi:hypothetical protein